jgi:hypothetical protein
VGGRRAESGKEANDGGSSFSTFFSGSTTGAEQWDARATILAARELDPQPLDKEGQRVRDTRADLDLGWEEDLAGEEFYEQKKGERDETFETYLRTVLLSVV